MSNSSVYYDLHSDDTDEDYSDEEVENKGNPKHVEMKFAGNRQVETIINHDNMYSS